MSIEVLVPNLPESVSDATLINWHKKVGDFINKNENLVDLETDKVVLEVTAPQTGILSQILKEDGAIVTSGELLAIIEGRSVITEDSIDTELITSDSTKNVDEDMPLSPSVRRLIHENSLDPTQINGTGKSGRLTKTDVLEHLNKSASTSSVGVQTPLQSRVNEPEKVTAKETVMVEAEIESSRPALGIRPEQRVPMTRLRAKVAERLLQAQQNAAMLTTFNEVNMQNVIDLRNQYKARFEQKHAVKLGFMSFFVKASIEALKHFPAINASIDGSDIVYHGYYDLGIAVSTPRGLIVPVLHDADQLDFAGIE